MKITGNNILLASIVVLLLLTTIVSADSEYCTPPTGYTVVLDNVGTWYNFTISYPVCMVCVDNGAGYGDVDCTPCASVAASFTSNVTCGNIPFNVQFTDTSTGTNITDWYWDFGDGKNSTLENPITNYTTVGFYNINHSANNSMGKSWSNVSGYMASRAVGDTCAAPGGTTGARFIVEGQSWIYLYVLLGLAAVFLAIYGLFDLRNRFYANIASLFMASILAWYLSTTASNGTMKYGVVVDQIAGTTTTIILTDAGLGWLLLIPASGAMIATAYLIYDAYEESKRNKEEEDDR